MFNLIDYNYYTSNIDLNHLPLIYQYNNNILKKIDILIDKEIQLISEFNLTSSHNANKTEKYPNIAYKFDNLEKGEYILYSKIPIENNLLVSSKGNVVFNKNIFYFKISNIKKFFIWFYNNDNLNFTHDTIILSLYKIKSTFDIDDNQLISSFIIPSSNLIISNLPSKFLFKFNVYEFNNELSGNQIIEKYPSGTFQISINEIIKSSTNDDFYQSIINDIKYFDINDNVNNTDNLKVNYKINSLNSILIQPDVNPFSYYLTIAHYELIAILDYNTDDIFVYQNSYLEAFLSLYIPNTTYDVLVENDEIHPYAIFKIDKYQFLNECNHIINNDFNSFCNEVKEKLHQIVSFNDNDFINKNDLYFYINNFSVINSIEIEKLKKDISNNFKYLTIYISRLLY